MTTGGRVGLMWHGDRQAREEANLATSKFAKAADALRAVGLEPEAVVYNDEFRDEVREQLLRLQAVQVWVNPISDGRDRTELDRLLREVSDRGVLVFTHPDTILRMGTKQVLVETRGMSWSSDVQSYSSVADLASGLPALLQAGPRVLKQLRGHSGTGIWLMRAVEPLNAIYDSTLMRLRHAERGSVEETVTFSAALDRMAPYFAAGGKMIAQSYQTRIGEGMTRVYMVEARVGGFGHQAVNALVPAAPGASPEEAPQPGARLYYPPDQAEFQALGSRMESEWVPNLQKCLGLTTAELPLLWDADFLLGPRDAAGNDTYVLCEINVSSVSPYPEWANPLLVQKLRERIENKKAPGLDGVKP